MDSLLPQTVPLRRSTFSSAPAACDAPVTPTKCHGAKAMSGANRARNRVELTPKIDLEGLATFLRRRHPTNTAEMVEAQTQSTSRIRAKTVRNWLAYENAPSLVHMFILWDVYGAEIVKASWPTDWMSIPCSLDAGHVAEELAAIEAATRRNETRRLELQAQLTRGAIR